MFSLCSYLLGDMYVFLLARYPQELKSMLNGSALLEFYPALTFSDNSGSAFHVVSVMDERAACLLFMPESYN